MMRKTNHIHSPDEDGRVYCFLHDEIEPLTSEFLQQTCANCAFFEGTAQGEGIECLYQDGSGRIVETYVDPVEAKQELSPSENRTKLNERRKDQPDKPEAT